MAALAACSSIDCPVENTVRTVYQVIDDDGAEISCADTVYVWSQRFDGQDTLLLNRAVGASQYSLPISSQRPADTLVWLVADTLHQFTLDTVVVEKEDLPHFESVDCATSFFHRIHRISTSHHGIDTIIINRSFVDYDSQTPHFYIRFKARH